MSTSTTRLGLYKPASGEDVNVVTDLNNNYDTIDLNMNFRTCTSSTRPSVVWDGLSIHETDTNRFYAWNSTPASSGWYEIFSSGGSIAQMNLAGTSSGAFTLTSKTTGKTQPQFEIRADGQVFWGDGTSSVDTNLYRSGVNTLKTDDAFTAVGAISTTDTTESTALSVSGGATVSKSLSIGGTASLGGAQGALGIKNVTTAPTATPSGGLILTSSGGRPLLYSAAGTNAEYMGGAYGLSPVSPVTVANTTTETTIGSVTIPANDAVIGAVYRLSAWGHASTTGTPTLRFRAFLAANQLAATQAFTTGTTVTNKAWSCEVLLVCLGTGGTGSWFGNLTCIESVSVAGAAPTTAAARNDGGATVSNATTSSNTFDLKATWGTASSSNTLTCRGFVVTRIA